MEIVVNKCYGGFALSNEAVIRLVEMNSDALQKRQDDTNAKECRILRDGFLLDGNENLYKDGFWYYYFRDNIEFRMHPDVIKVVKELSELASGSCSNLQVIEIYPSGIYIKDHDGRETVWMGGNRID